MLKKLSLFLFSAGLGLASAFANAGDNCGRCETEYEACISTGVKPPFDGDQICVQVLQICKEQCLQ